MSRISYLWTYHRTGLLAFLFVLAGAGFFGVRTLAAWVYWHDPAHQNQEIERWMTPRYVAQSYKLPPFVLGPVLFLDEEDTTRRMSLGRIAAQNGLTLNELQDRITKAAISWHANPDRDNWPKDE